LKKNKIMTYAFN